MKWLKVLIVALVASISLSRTAHAEQITTFDSNITVQQSGQVDVSESIVYDFEYASRHGIFRYIPRVYQDDAGNEYRPDITVTGVTMDGQPVPYKISNDGDNLMIKIGDPDKTITGAHTYEISYTVASLLVNKEGDLLRFNVTGGGWQVPITSARVVITGPALFKATCYAGQIGSTAADCSQQALGENSVQLTANNLGSGKDFTVEALWPTGTVGSLLQPYRSPWWVTAALVAAALYVISGIILCIAALVRWIGIRLAERRARFEQVVVAQYEAPANLTPGELGLISDNKASMVEVTATIIQAAVAGFIKIEQIDDGSLLKKPQFKLIKLKNFAGLPANEQPVFEALFAGKQEVNLGDVDRTSVPAVVQAYQKSLKERAKDKGLYTKQSKFASIGLGALVFSLVIISFTPMVIVVAAVMLPLGIYAYRRAGKTLRRTPEGLKTWAEIEGFRLFLSVTEKDRLAFSDAPKRSPKQFSAFLPYAIALGVEEEWAKQFEGMDVTKAAGWYSGPNSSFTVGYLVGSLHNSFAPAVATSSTAQSQTSSGGFGGGSSGGGFGGGGGGSW